MVKRLGGDYDFPKHSSFIMNAFAWVNSLTHNSPKNLGATTHF